MLINSSIKKCWEQSKALLQLLAWSVMLLGKFAHKKEEIAPNFHILGTFNAIMGEQATNVASLILPMGGCHIKHYFNILVNQILVWEYCT